MSRSCPVWLHDKLRKHFFHLEDGQITHCYRLEHKEVDGYSNYNHWWQVPIPQKRWARRRNLTLLPNQCEIEHQLHLLKRAKNPPAGWFLKRDDVRHPRHNQWGELIPMKRKPEHWGDGHLAPSDDFLPSPHFKKDH